MTDPNAPSVRLVVPSVNGPSDPHRPIDGSELDLLSKRITKERMGRYNTVGYSGTHMHGRFSDI